MLPMRGRSTRLSLPRRWVGDILHFGRQVPIITGERSIRVRDLVLARRSTPHPPSWSSIMLKGIGLTSQTIPELRQSYLSFPWARIHEMPYSVGTVVLDREYKGEHAVFACPLLHPEQQPLRSIQSSVDSWKTGPIEAHGPLRRIVRTSKLPQPIRRAMWWYGLNADGYQKARNFGTFAINCLAGYRSRIMQMCFPVTTFLYYGVPEKDGTMLIQLGFDHRVYDGYTAGRLTSELERKLNGPIAEEMHAMKADHTARCAA
jgi:hypothetical protein